MSSLWLRSLRGICRQAFGREARSPAVLSCQGWGEEGEEGRQCWRWHWPRRCSRAPQPAHLCRELGAHRPASPRARVALRPQSSGAGCRNYPVGWLPPPGGQSPEGSGRGTWPPRWPAAPGRSRAPAPPPRPQLPPTARRAARPLAPAGWSGRALTHSEGASKVTRVGGWGGSRHCLLRCAPLAAALPRSSATVFQTPGQNRLQSPGGEVERRGRQASGRGAALVGLSARGAGSGEVAARGGCGSGGRPGPRRLVRGWRPGAAGLRAAGCRQRGGARGAPGALEGRDKRADKPAEETN